MRISVIIPILNEAETIGRLLLYLLENASETNIEAVLVVDGGSTDGSQEIVNSFVAKDPSTALGVTLIKSEKGRAKQMNAGASATKGDILYFLHADTFPPKGFDARIVEQFSKGRQAGCFRLKFDNPHPVLRLSQWFTRFNFRVCRGGDQSLFVARSLFETLNGFDERFTIYEDSEFIGRLYDHSGFVVIAHDVTTSARRYQHNGTWRLQYHFAVIHLKRFFGTSPEGLYAYYRKYVGGNGEILK